MSEGQRKGTDSDEETKKPQNPVQIVGGTEKPYLFFDPNDTYCGLLRTEFTKVSKQVFPTFTILLLASFEEGGEHLSTTSTGRP